MTTLIVVASILAYLVAAGLHARKIYVYEIDHDDSDDMMMVVMAFVWWPLFIAFYAIRWVVERTIAAPTPRQREARRKTQEEKERKEYERALEILAESNSSNSGGVKLSSLTNVETFEGWRRRGNVEAPGAVKVPRTATEPPPPPPPPSGRMAPPPDRGWLKMERTPDML